jgi:lauroyl/myristoyl acyltransferase
MTSPLRLFRHDGPFWRGLASFGAAHAPEAVVRYSPPAWAFAFALAMPGMRAHIRKNLRLVLGPRSYPRELLDVFRTFSHFASCLTEGLAVGAARSHEKLHCRIEGAEHLQRAIALGRGVILVTAHTGAWEIAGPMLKKEFDRDVVIVMQREPNEQARQIQDRARQQSGIKVVHVGSEPLAALALVPHLRKGGIVGVQIDRAPDARRSIAVRLFGAPVRVPSGPFFLARACAAPILPVFTRRLGYFHYEIRLCPPLEIPKSASDDALARAAERAAAEMESFLGAHPTHWFDFGS